MTVIVTRSSSRLDRTSQVFSLVAQICDPDVVTDRSLARRQLSRTPRFQGVLSCDQIDRVITAAFPMLHGELPMKVVLSGRQESAKCAWCEKDRETVTTTFSDGLFKEANLCWQCLKTAFKVRSEASKRESETLQKQE